MKSKGKCRFCKEDSSGTVMARHLQACAKRKEAQTKETAKGKIFLLRASAEPFWVYFEAEVSSSLEELDLFLRELWLECCGHLSAFNIMGQTYASDPQDEFGDLSLDAKLATVLIPGLAFTYEYDFGTTTKLSLKCLAERPGEIKGISIAAKNDLPSFPCHCCEKEESKKICSQCLGEKEWMFCPSCVKKHNCDKYMLMPVVNSPRIGMCGYTG